jgi:hypothetical protein
VGIKDIAKITRTKAAKLIGLSIPVVDSIDCKALI